MRPAVRVTWIAVLALVHATCGMNIHARHSHWCSCTSKVPTKPKKNALPLTWSEFEPTKGMTVKRGFGTTALPQSSAAVSARFSPWQILLRFVLRSNGFSQFLSLR